MDNDNNTKPRKRVTAIPYVEIVNGEKVIRNMPINPIKKGKHENFRELSHKERDFCDFYLQSGDPRLAYSQAFGVPIGDSSVQKESTKLMQRKGIIKYLKEKNQLPVEVENARSLKTSEIRTFWTSIIENECADMKDRIKASELLAKTLGMFVERHEVTGKVNVEVVFNGSQDDWEDIIDAEIID